MRCQNPRSRYLVVCIYLFLPSRAHSHNKLGWEDTFITQHPPAYGGQPGISWLNRTSVFKTLFDTFDILTPFEITFLPERLEPLLFSESKTYPQVKMRRWTLKLRAQIVFFIIGTCVICQCGLINGESKYCFFLTFSKQCCSMFDITHILYCFQLLTARPNTPCI